MGKSVLQTVLPLAAAVAAPYAIGAMGAGGALGAGAGAAGAGAGAGAASGAGALGGAFGSADMLAAAAPGAGLLGSSAAAVPGGIESAGLLDMGGGNMVNPEYFVGESIGKPMFAGSSDLPLTERAGNVLGSMKDSLMPGEWDWMKSMRGMNMGQPKQVEQVSRPTSIQRPQAQPSTETQLPYSQGVQLSSEQKELLRQRMMMGGLLNGTA
jgi:hypothetical protein